MATLLISVNEVKKRSYLDDNVDDKIIKIGLVNAQEQMLEPTIGTKLYDKLIEDTEANNMATKYQTLLVDYIWNVLINATMYIVVRNLMFRYTRSGIVQSENSNSRAIDMQQLNGLKHEYDDAYNWHVKKLKLYLNRNASNFPEYLSPDLDDVPANFGKNLPFYYEPYDYFEDGTVGPSNYHFYKN